MANSFSIYEALLPYAQQAGARLSQKELGSLVEQISTSLQADAASKFLGRVEPDWISNDLNGTVFLPEGAPSSALTTNWEHCFVPEDDLLLNDVFLIADSSSLPIIVVAKEHEKDSKIYNVIVSIDEPLIEIGRMLLAQYTQNIYEPLTISPQAFQKAGVLLGELMEKYPPHLVSSWLSKALEGTLSTRLTTLQTATSALWIQFGGQVVGKRPVDSPTYRSVTVALAGGTTLDAVGYRQDSDFMNRCHASAGLLSTLSSDSIEAATSEVRQVNFDVFSQINFDDDLSQVEVNPMAENVKPLASLDDWPALPDDWPPEIDAETSSANDVNSAIAATTATALKAVEAAVEEINVPDVSAELLEFVNHEISFLRDRILDLGFKTDSVANSGEVLRQFIDRSGELLLLIDEVIYLQRMVENIAEEHELVETHSLLGALVMTYAGEAERRGVDLNYDVPDDLPLFEGNPEALNRAMMIMVEFAVDQAAPRGEVDLGARFTDTEHVELFVRSTGSALTPVELDKILQPDFSADLKVAENGNKGLGFSALKSIAEAHHGKLKISYEDQKNVVKLLIPRQFLGVN